MIDPQGGHNGHDLFPNIVERKLTNWLAAHDNRLDRFTHPVPLADVASEVAEPAESIRSFLCESQQPIFHTWTHVYRGQKSSRSKPYCLRLSGPDDVCLDWEDSVVGVTEREFVRRGYECRQQIGSREHLSRLCSEPSLATLIPGVNLRDFWALRRSGPDIDLYIVEAKGKEAGGFELYMVLSTFAETGKTWARASAKQCWVPREGQGMVFAGAPR